MFVGNGNSTPGSLRLPTAPWLSNDKEDLLRNAGPFSRLIEDSVRKVKIVVLSASNLKQKNRTTYSYIFSLGAPPAGCFFIAVTVSKPRASFASILDC